MSPAKVFRIDPDLPPLTEQQIEQVENSLFLKHWVLPELATNARGWSYLLDETRWPNGDPLPIEQAELCVRDTFGEIELLWHLSSPAARERIEARMIPVLELMEKNRLRAEAHIAKHAERAAKGAR
jgi:hypothetical protein